MSFKYNVMGSVGFGNILETILKNKGIQNINAFLNPTESCLESELLFDNIIQARDCLINHISKNCKITIIVDCDVDGFTSAALMYMYIKQIKHTIDIRYILHNGKEHGLDKTVLDQISKDNCDLLIIPDAGSNDYKQHKTLKGKGIDIIVLDHHLADKYSKDAIVVNNQMSNKIIDKAMTGVGVVYKFCKVLDTFYNVDFADDYLDLVAVGMIADSCDLRTIQSRYLVLQGINQIKDEINKNKFVTQLIKSQDFSMGGKVTITGISFYIAPLINSLIRIGEYKAKESMFKAFINCTENVIDKVRGKGDVEMSMQEYAVRLCESSRRKQKKITDDCVELMKQQIDAYRLDSKAILVCNATDVIHENYTGLIANKLASKYNRPCLLLRKTKTEFTGSGRGYDKSSINNFNQWCKDTGLFNMVEGHAGAFGTKIKADNITRLYEIIDTITYSDELYYTVDAKFNDKSLTKTVIEMIAKYADVWGTSIEEPIFAIENISVSVNDINLIGKNQNTIKFTFHNIEFIKFNSSVEDFTKIIETSDNIKFTIIGKFSINEYGGVKTPQVIIEDYMFEKSDEIKQFRF